jgi:hypothetical protein
VATTRVAVGAVEEGVEEGAEVAGAVGVAVVGEAAR